MTDETDVSKWNARQVPQGDTVLVVYTCPLCGTTWTVNVAQGEPSTQLWCHKDGSNAIYEL